MTVPKRSQCNILLQMQIMTTIFAEMAAKKPKPYEISCE